MPEVQKSRTLPEIEQEYARLCAKAGHVQYQVAQLQKDLGLLNARLQEVNVEAATVRQQEAAAKAAAPAVEAAVKE